MSEDGQPDRKRPRTELDEEVYVDHPTLYFDDGSVILKCKKTLFCVQGSLISRHSPVIDQKLAIAKHVKGDDHTMRGKPLLKLDDDPYDIEVLLDSFYNGLRVDVPELTVENFPMVASLFRMSTKYGVQRLKEDIIVLFKREWPIGLPEHLAKWRVLRLTLARSASQTKQFIWINNNQMIPNPAYNPHVPEDLIPDPATVIALLRAAKYADPELLTPLFYDLSCRVWQYGPSFTGHRMGVLPPADAERLAFGLSSLRAAQAARAAVYPQFVYHSQHPQHSTINTWWPNVALQKLLMTEPNPMSLPIEDWELLKSEVAPLGNVCGMCRTQMLNFIDEAQKEIWGSLGKTFGLV